MCVYTHTHIHDICSTCVCGTHIHSTILIVHVLPHVCVHDVCQYDVCQCHVYRAAELCDGLCVPCTYMNVVQHTYIHTYI